jgi:hypothetical protein
MVEPNVTIATRHFCLAILLGFLVGHMGIAAHAASHAAGDASDAGGCELCMTYGDSADAVEVVNALGLPDSRYKNLAESKRPTPEDRRVVPFRPRGPPLAD